jgi:hypothetical protein
VFAGTFMTFACLAVSLSRGGGLSAWRLARGEGSEKRHKTDHRALYPEGKMMQRGLHHFFLCKPGCIISLTLVPTFFFDAT